MTSLSSLLSGTYSGYSGLSGYSGYSGVSGSTVRYLQIVAVEKSSAIQNGTDIIGQIEFPTNGTVTNLRAKTTSGTATVTFKVNGSSIGSVNATSTGVSSAVSSAVTAYDDLTIDVSSASGTGLVVTLTME